MAGGSQHPLSGAVGFGSFGKLSLVDPGFGGPDVGGGGAFVALDCIIKTAQAILLVVLGTGDWLLIHQYPTVSHGRTGANPGDG